MSKHQKQARAAVQPVLSAEQKAGYTFTIPLKPVPKARARTFQSAGGKYRTVTPATTRAYEKAVASFAAGVQRYPKGVPLYVEAEFSSTKVDVKMGPMGSDAYRTTRPDIDNLLKSLLDGMKGCWDDDSQVVILTGWKYKTEAFRLGSGGLNTRYQSPEGR